jgi:hypothetical protein
MFVDVTPPAQDGVMEATSVRYAGAVKSLSDAARRRGLRVPAFRSPPRVDGCARTIRWRPDGGATVAIRLKGRLWVQVLADMVEGVVVTNGLRGADADQARTALWSAVEGGGLQAA